MWLAVALVAFAAGCRGTSVRAGDGPAGPPGAPEGGPRVALSEPVPQDAAPPPERTGERVEEPASGMLPAPPPPSPAEAPSGAGDLLPATAPPEEKAAECTRNDDGAGCAPTSGVAGRLAHPAVPAPSPPVAPTAGADDVRTERLSPQGDEAGLVGDRTSATSSGGSRRASTGTPLPPPPPSPPPPTVSPATLAAPSVPPPAALPSAGTTPGSAERTATAGSGGGLPASTVRTLLRRREAALQRCYDGLLLRAPGTGSGSLSVRLQIRTTGEVERVERVGGTLEDADFERCVLEQLRRIGFPAADTPTVFTHSFQFAPSGAAAPLVE